MTLTFLIDAWGTAASNCDSSFLDIYDKYYYTNNNVRNEKIMQWFNDLGSFETIANVMNSDVKTILVPTNIPSVGTKWYSYYSQVHHTTTWEDLGDWLFGHWGEVDDTYYTKDSTPHTASDSLNKSYWNDNKQTNTWTNAGAFQSLYGSSIKTSSGIFLFKTLANAVKYIKKDKPIMKTTNGSYFTYKIDDVLLPSEVIPNIFEPNATINATTNSGSTTLSQSYQGMFNDAIDACNTTATQLATYGSNFNSTTNLNTYKSRLASIRNDYNLEDANNNLYMSGTQPQETYCYFTPQTTPWFNPTDYNSGLMTEAKDKCNQLSTVIKQEAVDCCINPWTMTESGFKNCNITNTDPNNAYQGCNSGTIVNTDAAVSIITGTANQSFNVSSSDYEGFTNQKEGMTVQQETDSMNSICKANHTIVENTLNKISSPAGASAFANITSTLYPNASDYSDVKSTVTQKGSNYLAYSTYTWPTDINSALTTRSRITTKYDACTTGINDCSTPSSLVMLDSTGTNYLATTNPPKNCNEYNTQYTTAMNLCTHAYDMGVQFKDTNGEKILSQYINDISYGTLGRTMTETDDVLTQAAHQCNEWVKMYDIFENDEQRASMIPCKPTRPISNGFDAEINTIVSNWNNESSKYIAMLKAKLEAIQTYVEKYASQTFDVSLVNVPNGTPNTPFIDIKPSGYDSSTPPNYTITAYMPAGPPGPAGKAGQVGGRGPIGLAGSTGKPGPVGISEIPIQYTPYE
jgi:hypothetical protein